MSQTHTLSLTCSVSELADFTADTVESATEGHIHELRLSVHLKAAKNRIVDLVVNGELLAFVLGVGLKGGDNL